MEVNTELQDITKQPYKSYIVPHIHHSVHHSGGAMKVHIFHKNTEKFQSAQFISL